jgi:hypothetical protein
VSKPVSHQLDIYGAWLHVATDRRAWVALRRKINSLDADPGAMGHTSLEVDTHDRKNTPHVVMYLDMAATDTQAELVDLIAHEATHAAAGLLDHLGQKPGDSEALAYLVGFIAAFAWGVCEA